MLTEKVKAGRLSEVLFDTFLTTFNIVFLFPSKSCMLLKTFHIDYNSNTFHLTIMTPDIGYTSHQAHNNGLNLNPITDRRAVIQKLQGQKVLVPDILSYMPAWRLGLHPAVDTINKELDTWLKTIDIDERKKIKHRKKGNYTWLTGAYYSDAKKEKILLLSQFLYWVR